ncbi:MAG: murein biosynthesis integral membrane protein MurJ [Caldilineaceae bacterium]|nr:murein biosynthesis integral membrane protein MurJ [Caldilineaceae bacterium]
MSTPLPAVDAEEETPAVAQSELARSALLLSIGNIASRVLGLVREMVIARMFDARLVGVFTVASQVPTLLYDLLIGGMLSAALVPVLSAYVQQDRREFGRVVNLLVTAFGLLLTIVTIGLFWGAPQVAWLLAGGFETTDPALSPLTIQLIQWMTPAVWLFCMAGLLTAVLYALQRFTWPAMATAIYNLGIIIAAPLLVQQLGIASLVVGILMGALTQSLLMWWDVRRAGIRLELRFNWRHPALRKIGQLYLPIAVGLVVSLFQTGLDRRLASGISAESMAWMRYATTLQQLPLGLISVAIALAALPRLSQYVAHQQEPAYRQTLGRGLRMVLLLITPAAVGLWLLGEPVTRIIFQHGRSSVQDTSQIVQALHIYLVGMLFAAIDFPLNYAFYARNNTFLPALVGVISVVVYIITAFALLADWGYLGLVWADTAKQASHALIMIGLLRWRVGRLSAQVGVGFLQISSATVVMTLVMTAAMAFVHWLLRTPDGTLPVTFWSDGVTLLLVGGAGLLSYWAVLRCWNFQEIDQLWATMGQRLGFGRRRF